MSADTVFYGEQTRLAAALFGTVQTPPELIRAMGEVKKAALLAQQEHASLYPADFFEDLLQAADRMIRGDLDDQFILPLRQGGAGTSLHMNANEVLAASANDLHARRGGSFRADPLDHIGRYQSTNDVLPTAVTIVALRKLRDIEARVIGLQERLVRKETEYGDLLMAGRTELQDALPITLGQVFGSWAGSIERDRWRLSKLKERVRTVALGGTAQGTCFFAPRGYVHLAERHLRAVTGLPLCRSQNLPDEIGNQDKLAEVTSGFALCALNLFRIAGDLLLYSASFLGELPHPELQYGSTIMPAKSNPVLLEYVRGLSVDVRHEAAKVEEFAANGQLQLNPYLPFILEALLRSSDSLSRALEALTDLTEQLEPDRERIRRNLLGSPAMLNTLRPHLRYQALKETARLIAERRPADPEEYAAVVVEASGLNVDFVLKSLDPARMSTFSEEDA